MLEPLATVGADSGAKPWLAKTWYPNTTFTRWVINLQTGVTFQDGEPFNADAVVAEHQRLGQGPAVRPGHRAHVQGREGAHADQRRGRPDPAVGRLPQQLPDGGSAYMMAPVA